MSHEPVSDPECLISAEQIVARVQELGEQITRDYAGKELLLIGVLKGAWVFVADLARRIDLPIQVEFVQLSSYGMGTETSGRPELLLPCRVPLAGRHVLVIDDILDTGNSMAYLLETLRDGQPASLRVCVLLDKPSRRTADVAADYVGFSVPDLFVVGYGIDWAERFRHLPYVGWVRPCE